MRVRMYAYICVRAYEGERERKRDRKKERERAGLVCAKESEQIYKI